MVAHKSALADRFIAPSDDLITGRMRLVSFTRSDAEALVRMGIVPEDASTELLNGWIVLKDRSAVGQDPTLIGQGHKKCVEAV